MRALNRKIDQFCFNHPRFGIPRLMLYIVIGNIVVWLAIQMDTTHMLGNLLIFRPDLFCRGQIWRLLTYPLVPSSNGILWLALSLYFYYFIGTNLENAWGAGKFTIYYLSGMALSCLYSLVYYWISGAVVSMTASYLNLSMFFAFATLWPDQRVLLFFFIPVKMKWLGWLDAAMFAISIVRYFQVGGLGLALVPVVALLNYLIFCGEWLIDAFRPSTVRQKTRQRAKTIQFKQAAKKTQREQQAQGYTRKCAVCGVTDRDRPDMEFRYCSRCVGYHCFCQNHINNHIHFTE